MPKSRELIYINASETEDYIISYGIEFKEFINSLEEPIENLLVLAGDYFGEDFNLNTRCEYVTKETIFSILEEDVYRYGDFCWVDFADVKTLKELEPQEVAELLYLGHLMKPINSPFFDRLQNRFVYLAHDDGWFNKFYCRNKIEFNSMISNLIPKKATLKTKRKIISSLTPEVGHQLMELAKEGLLIDFDRIIKDGRTLEVPIFVIGNFLDMDEMYNDLQRHVKKAKYGASLEFKKNQWSIQPYDYRYSY